MPSADALSPAEALARAGSGALLSHETAARALGIELLSSGVNRLTVPPQRSRLLIPGWQVVRSAVASAERFTWEDVMSRPEHVIGLVRQLLAVAA